MNILDSFIKLKNTNFNDIYLEFVSMCDCPVWDDTKWFFNINKLKNEKRYIRVCACLVIYYISKAKDAIEHKYFTTIQAIRNRYIEKYYTLDTGLDKWYYYDIDYRITEALFNSIIWFVDVELTDHQDMLKDIFGTTGNVDDDEAKNYKNSGVAYLELNKQEISEYQDILDIYYYAINRPKDSLLGFKNDAMYEMETKLLVKLINVRRYLWT